LAGFLNNLIWNGQQYDGGLDRSNCLIQKVAVSSGAFLTTGVVLAVGIAAYVFILGWLELIADPQAA
jgi:hypothetical protein